LWHLVSEERVSHNIGWRWQKLTIASLSGVPVRVDRIARLERGFGPTQLRRTNRQFSIVVGLTR
jgi:hypothetical protein